MKKALVFLFIAAIAFSFVSCAQGKETEIFDYDFNAEAEESYDFHGKELVFIGEEREGRIEVNPYEHYENSEWTERLRQRYKDIEKKYNIKFVFKKSPGGLAATHAAGLHWADLYDARSDAHWPNMDAGLYNSLTLVPGFVEGIEEGQWGPVRLVEYFKRGDDYQAFYPGFHGIPFPQMGGVFYANLTVLHQFGFDPFELIESGEWTWNTFRHILETIGGTPNDPNSVFGMYYQTSFPDYFLTTLILNNGGSLVRRDENGRYVCNLDSKEAVEAMEWAQTLYKDGVVAIQNDGEKYPTFIENRLAFIYEYTYVGTVDASDNGFMYNDVDFAIVPCPAGPSAKYGEWKSYLGYADRLIAVPITADMDIIDAILTDLYSPLGDDPFEWREVYARQNFLHEESAEYYFTMYDNAEPDYYRAMNLFQWSSVLNARKGIAEAIDGSRDNIQAVLDRDFNKN
jgi:ABC-type glycerol-3-phosphate transport system substrate-binding protein